MLIGAVIVAALVSVSILAISMTEISDLTITVYNNSDQDLKVRVWVDEFDDQSVTLEAHERMSFHWDITGKLTHRYFVLHHEPGILVSVGLIWTYIDVHPFGDETIDLTVL